MSEGTALDGGWGWMVVLASFVAHMIADGCGFSFGVLFSELLEVFGESKSTTAWIGSLFVSVPAICGPIASVVANSYGCRTTTMIGGLIASFGCFAASYANSIGELCFSFGIVAGFGLSLVLVPAVVVVAFYFEKKRAFATGLAVAGSGVGTTIFAPLTEMLLREYQWRGTLLIFSAIMLNFVVCGAVFRPLHTEIVVRKDRKKKDGKVDGKVDRKVDGKVDGRVDGKVNERKHLESVMSEEGVEEMVVVVEEGKTMTYAQRMISKLNGMSTGRLLRISETSSGSAGASNKDLNQQLETDSLEKQSCERGFKSEPNLIRNNSIFNHSQSKDNTDVCLLKDPSNSVTFHANDLALSRSDDIFMHSTAEKNKISSEVILKEDGVFTKSLASLHENIKRTHTSPRYMHRLSVCTNKPIHQTETSLKTKTPNQDLKQNKRVEKSYDCGVSLDQINLRSTAACFCREHYVHENTCTKSIEKDAFGNSDKQKHVCENGIKIEVTEIDNLCKNLSSSNEDNTKYAQNCNSPNEHSEHSCKFIISKAHFTQARCASVNFRTLSNNCRCQNNLRNCANNLINGIKLNNSDILSKQYAEQIVDLGSKAIMKELKVGGSNYETTSLTNNQSNNDDPGGIKLKNSLKTPLQCEHSLYRANFPQTTHTSNNLKHMETKPTGSTQNKATKTTGTTQNKASKTTGSTQNKPTKTTPNGVIQQAPIQSKPIQLTPSSQPSQIPQTTLSRPQTSLSQAPKPSQTTPSQTQTTLLQPPQITPSMAQTTSSMAQTTPSMAQTTPCKTTKYHLEGMSDSDKLIFLRARQDMVYRGSLLRAGFFLHHSRSASCPEVCLTPRKKSRFRNRSKLLNSICCCGHYYNDTASSCGSDDRLSKCSYKTTLKQLKKCKKIVDFSVFRSPVFSLFNIHTVLLFLSYDIPYLYGPNRASKFGIEDRDASYLVSIIGIFSMMGQVMMGYLGDQPYLNVTVFYNVMTAIAGVFVTLIPFTTTFASTAVFLAGYGFFISANFALTTVILVELLGMKRLTNAFGIVSMSQGIANLLGPPLAGWLSDMTGSYDLTFYGAGLIIVVSGLVLFLAPCLGKYDGYKLKDGDDGGGGEMVVEVRAIDGGGSDGGDDGGGDGGGDGDGEGVSGDGGGCGDDDEGGGGGDGSNGEMVGVANGQNMVVNGVRAE